MLSTSELKRWCRLHIRRGARKYVMDRNREFATNAFIRAIGIDSPSFSAWLDKDESLPARVQNTMSKFIADWEAGLIEFTPYSTTKPRVLVRRAKPGGRRRRFAVTLGARPGIVIRESPAPAPAMPSFRELIRTKI